MARKLGTIKTFGDLWIAHEKLYCSIFWEALAQLEITDEERKDEDAISEAICPILNNICFACENDIMPPIWEQPNQPRIKAELKGGKIRKRPDFTCNFLNPLATSSKTYVIPFHIECKRLGKNTSSWNLNKNYVTNGIKRFDCSDHEYGKKAPSGMMIGYIIGMEQSTILRDVNLHLSDNLTKLKFELTEKVVLCQQCILRKYIKPENFKILHLWADLRN